MKRVDSDTTPALRLLALTGTTVLPVTGTLAVPVGVEGRLQVSVCGFACVCACVHGVKRPGRLRVVGRCGVTNDVTNHKYLRGLEI